jgi:hypothetical protein
MGIAPSLQTMTTIEERAARLAEKLRELNIDPDAL